MVTDPQSLSERLREIADGADREDQASDLDKAADALDAKDAELDKWQKLARQGIDIEQELRRTEWQQATLLGQAVAALKHFETGSLWGTLLAWVVEGAPKRHDGIYAAKMIVEYQIKVDKALAAIRAKEPANE